MSTVRRAAEALLYSVLGALALGANAADIAVGHFSQFSPATPPVGWKSYSIGKSQPLTQYRVVTLDGQSVLEASAESSVSSLVYALRADPQQTPWLAWRWRTERMLEGADIATKAGDDYVARIYVLFDYDLSKLPLGERLKVRVARALYGNEVPGAALCYVWDNRQPVGYTQWSSYSNRLRLIVAESGATRLGQWASIERNVAEDFRAAFGEDAPPITAIVVATDTDNTHDSAHTWFGDITLRAARAGER